MVVRISESEAQSAAIWKGRKSAFGAIGRIADYFCMDGTIPLGRLPEVLVRITSICKQHGLRVANIFHAGDGNLHPLILYDANKPELREEPLVKNVTQQLSDIQKLVTFSGTGTPTAEDVQKLNGAVSKLMEDIQQKPDTK